MTTSVGWFRCGRTVTTRCNAPRLSAQSFERFHTRATTARSTPPAWWLLSTPCTWTISSLGLRQMGIDSCDVAIVGGGPAGCATAISLMTHAPSLSVVLIEASNYESFRVGESLPPPARSLLEHLGVWEAFASQPHRQTYGTTSSWGTESLQQNEYFFFPANAGWHIDRVAFDALLSEEARRRGAGLLLNVRVHQAKRDVQKWCLKLASGR